MQRRLITEDYYQVLELPVTASTREVNRSFLRLANLYHPDLLPDDPNAADRYQLIIRAHEILCDPGTRRAYDTDHYPIVVWTRQLQQMERQQQLERQQQRQQWDGRTWVGGFSQYAHGQSNSAPRPPPPSPQHPQLPQLPEMLSAAYDDVPVYDAASLWAASDLDTLLYARDAASDDIEYHNRALDDARHWTLHAQTGLDEAEKQLQDSKAQLAELDAVRAETNTQNGPVAASEEKMGDAVYSQDTVSRVILLVRIALRQQNRDRARQVAVEWAEMERRAQLELDEQMDDFRLIQRAIAAKRG